MSSWDRYDFLDCYSIVLLIAVLGSYENLTISLEHWLKTPTPKLYHLLVSLLKVTFHSKTFVRTTSRSVYENLHGRWVSFSIIHPQAPYDRLITKANTKLM